MIRKLEKELDYLRDHEGISSKKHDLTINEVKITIKNESNLVE